VVEKLLSESEDLESLPGVGPATAEKLREAGYLNLESVAVATPQEVVAVTGLGDTIAAKIIQAARKSLDLGFKSAEEVLKDRQNTKKIATGSKNIDNILGGGIETSAMIEFFGEFRTGKTQLCHMCTVTVQLPEEEGGIEAKSVYIDSEGTFRPERIISMAQRVGKDPQEIMKGIYVARAFNTDHQIALADKAAKMAKEKNIRLLVIDSLTSHFRAEYVGRESLASRQQMLNKHLHQLLRFAEINNAAVIVANQVMARPDAFFGDPTIAVGGHVMAHAATTRVYLRKGKGELRVARIFDSPCLPETETTFKIAEGGIIDP
jgi:DNA repair protein RadA